MRTGRVVTPPRSGSRCGRPRIGASSPICPASTGPPSPPPPSPRWSAASTSRPAASTSSSTPAGSPPSVGAPRRGAVCSPAAGGSWSFHPTPPPRSPTRSTRSSRRSARSGCGAIQARIGRCTSAGTTWSTCPGAPIPTSGSCSPCPAAHGWCCSPPRSPKTGSCSPKTAACPEVPVCTSCPAGHRLATWPSSVRRSRCGARRMVCRRSTPSRSSGCGSSPCPTGRRSAAPPGRRSRPPAAAGPWRSGRPTARMRFAGGARARRARPAPDRRRAGS